MKDEDWALVEKVANILEPIHEATLAVCAEKNPTMSMMMPFFDSILDTFEASSAEFRHAGLINEQADTIADGLDAGCAKLQKYFAISSELAIVATVLDPRFKMEYYQENHDGLHLQKVRKFTEDLSIKLGLNEYRNDFRQSDTGTKKTNLPSFLCDKVQKPTMKSTLDELAKFLREPTVENVEVKPLKWWKDNKCRYPKLVEVI